MSWIVACACGSSTPSPPPEPTTKPPSPWPVPTGFRGETIPFPLDFAPGLAHKGVEELRFAPGFVDPAAAGYWEVCTCVGAAGGCVSWENSSSAPMSGAPVRA